MKTSGLSCRIGTESKVALCGREEEVHEEWRLLRCYAVWLL
jgi:hypothetical protein